MSYTKKIGRHYGSLMQNLNHQRNMGEFCDLTIIIQKDHFSAHKCVLAAASKKLCCLIGRLTTGCVELRIDSITSQGFKIVLEYIYTSSLRLPAECLADVSNAAMFLEMDDLIQSCLAFDYPAQTSSIQNKPDTRAFQAQNSVTSNGRDFPETSTENLSSDLIENKLPELDSSIGGFLETDQTGPSSTGVSNYDDAQVGSSNNREDSGNNFGTYPDQDALSEISVQNDGPGDDDLMYNLPPNDLTMLPNNANNLGGDFSYHPYGPPPPPPHPSIDQGFPSRHLPKMLHPNMALLPPGMLPTHSFLPDQNQYQMDGYFLPQPSQYYPGNLVNNFIAGDHTREVYDNLDDQNYGPLPMPQNLSSLDVDKQRPFSSYGPPKPSNPSPYPQMAHNYNVPYPQDYDQTAKSARNYTSDFEDDMPMNSVRSVSVTDSQGLMSNPSPLPQAQAFQNDPESSTMRSHEYPAGKEASSGTYHQSRNSLASPTHDHQISQVMDSVKSKNTANGSKPNESLSTESSATSSTSNQVEVPSKTSTSHFSSRPVARMPPKKAGYRGIESDYNREFNTGIKSNIVGQYDNLAAIVESHGNTSRQYQNNETQNTSAASKDIEHSRNDSSAEKSKDTQHSSRNEEQSIVEERTDSVSLERRNYSSTEYSHTTRRDNVHDFYLANDPYNETNENSERDLRHSPYESTPHQTVSNHKPSFPDQPFHDATSSEFYDFPNVGSSQNIENLPTAVRNETENAHTALLSPISTQSMDIGEYDPRDPRDMSFNPALVQTNSYDGASQFSSFAKVLNITPSKSNLADTVYSQIEDYLRSFDPQQCQSPIKMPSTLSNNNINYQTGAGFTPISLHATYTPVTSSLYVNTQNTHTAIASPIYTNISPTPISTSQISVDPTPAPQRTISSSFSVEDVRKNILNVLSQEKFDDNMDTTKNQQSLLYSAGYSQDRSQRERSSMNKDRQQEITETDDVNTQNVTSAAESTNHMQDLTQLNNLCHMEPLQQPVSSSRRNSAENKYEQKCESAEMSEQVETATTDNLPNVPQFEDIDSDSCSESNYRLVIDFDKEIHREEPNAAFSTDKTTQVIVVQPTVRSNAKQTGSGGKPPGKGGKSIVSNKRQIGTVSHKLKETQADAAEIDPNEPIASPPSNPPSVCSEDVKVKVSGSNAQGSGRRKRHQPIKIPKYTLRTEYKESSENRSGSKANEGIKKPLKKRIKLSLNMTKLQDDDDDVMVTSMRASKIRAKTKKPNRRIKYTCELCGREFWERYKAFAEHMQAHSRDELCTCAVCGQGYQRVEDLTRHRNTVHNLLAFDCEVCDAHFTNPKLYRKHCIDEHKAEKMFRCLYANCDFRSNRLNVLERHTLIHGNERQFECVQCSAKFSQPNGLRHHLLSCMNMQQFVCGQCGRSFNRVSSLREHEAMHAGAKKYTCIVCQASFSDHRNLKRHTRIHTNEMPYECKHCHEKFRYSNVLKRHLVSKHKDSVEKGKKGSKNKESVLIKNYNANAIACS